MHSPFFAVSTSNGRKAKQNPKGSGSGTTLSVIGAGMRLEGLITSSGSVRIEGTVVGDIRSESQVLVAEGGRVEGDIHAPEVIANGEVKGSILASDRAELHPSSVVTGSIATKRLAVQEGSRISGHVRTGEQRTIPKHDSENRPTAGVEGLHPDVPGARLGTPLGTRRAS